MSGLGRKSVIPKSHKIELLWHLMTFSLYTEWYVIPKIRYISKRLYWLGTPTRILLYNDDHHYETVLSVLFATVVANALKRKREQMRLKWRSAIGALMPLSPHHLPRTLRLYPGSIKPSARKTVKKRETPNSKQERFLLVSRFCRPNPQTVKPSACSSKKNTKRETKTFF